MAVSTDLLINAGGWVQVQLDSPTQVTSERAAYSLTPCIPDLKRIPDLEKRVPDLKRIPDPEKRVPDLKRIPDLEKRVPDLGKLNPKHIPVPGV